MYNVTPQLIATTSDFIPEGGTRGWTGDIPICSRMLYHWAMPPVTSESFGLRVTYLVAEIVELESSQSDWKGGEKNARKLDIFYENQI